MLSETAVEYLSSLTYREDATRLNCFLPLAGIYWNDEIPDFNHLFKLSESDRNLVLRLFNIRLKIWDHPNLDQSDQAFWDAARTQVPSYALFRRLQLSAEDREAQDAVFKETVDGLETWFSHADKVEISGDANATNFSFTYDRYKGEKNPPPEPPLLSRSRTRQWLFPVLLELAPTIEADLVAAIGLLWALVLAVALAVGGWGLILSVVVSFLAAFCLGLLCIVVEREGHVQLLQPARILSFCGVGLALSMFSLAGDCVIGFLRAPAVSWYVACTEKAGIGFGITALLAFCTVGITLVAVLRLAVRHGRNHWS